MQTLNQVSIDIKLYQARNKLFKNHLKLLLKNRDQFFKFFQKISEVSIAIQADQIEQ